MMLDTPGPIGYRLLVTCPDITDSIDHGPDDRDLPSSDQHPLAVWPREDPDLLVRAAYAVRTVDGCRSADGEDAVQDLALELFTSGRVAGDAPGFISPDAAQRWLTSAASERVRSIRGLASSARVDETATRFSPAAMEAVIDARELVAQADRLTGDRASTLLACIRRDITYAEAGAEMSLTRQRAQQCAVKLTAQLRRHQRVQEAKCRR